MVCKFFLGGNKMRLACTQLNGKIIYKMRKEGPQ
jgi:hypothetical protein